MREVIYEISGGKKKMDKWFFPACWQKDFNLEWFLQVQNPVWFYTFFMNVVCYS
jgi:hypothetical protein